MGSLQKSYKINNDIAAALHDFALRIGYGSDNALIRGVLRYTLLCQSKHSVSQRWEDLPPKDQDQLDEAIFILVQAKQGMTAEEAKSITFEQILERAAKAKAQMEQSKKDGQ